MNCEDVQKYAFTYLDGEFGSRERAEFDCHVAACGGCRAQVAQAAAFRGALRRNLCAARLDADTRQRLATRLASCERGASLSSLAPLAMAAGLALMAGVGSWALVGDGGDGEEQPSLMPRGDGAAAAGGGAQAGAAAVVTVGLGAVDAAAREAIDLRRRAAAAREAHDAVMRQVAHDEGTAEREGWGEPEVLGGAVDASFLTRSSPFGAVRAPTNLRAMVRVHASPLPPEVRGHATEVRRWLAERLPGVQGPPVPEGAGVELQGARLSQLAGRPVVLYAYVAYGKPMTVVQHLRAAGRAPFEDPDVETERPGEPSGARDGSLVDHVAGFQILHALRHDQLLSVVSELDSAALSSLVAPPTFL